MSFCTVILNNISGVQQLLCSFILSHGSARGKLWELAILAMGNGVQTPSTQLPLQEGQKLQLFLFCHGGEEKADEEQLL